MNGFERLLDVFGKVFSLYAGFGDVTSSFLGRGDTEEETEIEGGVESAKDLGVELREEESGEEETGSG